MNLWKFLKFLRQNTFSMISICVFKFLFYFRFHNCSLWIKHCIWLHGYAGKYIFLNTLHDYSDKIIKNAFFCFLFFWIKIALFKNFVKKLRFSEIFGRRDLSPQCCFLGCYDVFCWIVPVYGFRIGAWSCYLQHCCPGQFILLLNKYF